MSKRYRTLFPAPAVDESQMKLPEPERPPEKRQKLHLACLSCRVKKSKCDGKRPTCDRCTKRKTACRYAEEEKASTISGLQAQVQKLKEELDEHTGFLACLQSVPQAEANNILKQLRTSSNASQILASVQGSLAAQARPSDLRHARGLMPPTGSSIEFELNFLHGMLYPALVPIHPKSINIDSLLRSAPRSSHHPPAQATPISDWEGENALSSPWHGISSAPITSVSGPSETPEYCDERLKHLNIGYWTRVPLDNVFAASAISLYLESEHPFFGVFDADLVIDSLVYQRIEFCSPFLAVSLLYMACQSFTTVDIKSSSLVPALFHEAHKLYRAEGSDNRPLTIAATMLFGFASIMAGRETLALDLFATARRKAVETRLFGVCHAGSLNDQWAEWRQLSSDQLREKAHVAWGSFNWLAINAAFYSIEPIEYAPMFPIPGNRNCDKSNPSPPFWPSHKSLAYMGHTFSALSNLCVLTQEIYAVYHRAEGDLNAVQPSLAFAETKFQALLSWADTVPKELACGNNSPAHAYSLFCLCHGTVLYILRPFLGTDATLRLRSFAAEDSTLDKIFDASMKQLKRLLYIYVSQLQSTLYSPTLSCGMLHLTNALMKTVPAADDRDEWRFYFRLSLSYLTELYKRYPIWIDIIKANLAMAVDSGNLTMAEALAIVADVARSGQHHGVVEHVFTSCILDFELALTDQKQARVHQLALKFDQLALFDEFTTVTGVPEVHADDDADPDVDHETCPNVPSHPIATHDFGGECV
ncbi:hypothetical protein PG999_010312 [Apiospora kogelbergensis]|uniref:Zn(2)-C6 fungal-type domain-containing protein n=1 Tax=Apiospora kogelbergensis TaxID=1337665 RepID=A0AAW0QFF0_9PEZI